MNEPDPARDFSYDLAFSYAGEDREYVERVARAIEGRVRVFYDQHEQVDLWGRNLSTHLADVYGRKSRFCVMFISKHYSTKVWTNRERESAQERAFNSHETYLLPARFDDTAIPGVLSTVGYVDLRSLTPEEFGELLLEKLRLSRPRVFISCRSDAGEDLEVATSFYEALSAGGASPFLAPRSIADRNQWIQAVSEALRGCDAFLLLFSRQAAVSELVTAELEMARQLSASGQGRPRIVPVRVRLSEADAQGCPLGERLQDLEQLTWSGPADTQAIVARLLERTGGHDQRPALRSLPGIQAPTPPPFAVPPAAAEAPLELPGGIVSGKSRYYVTRPSVDEPCLREVLKPGSLIRIKAPRQMGKSSLMAVISDHAARARARTVTLNLQMADGGILADQDRFLRWLCAVATRRLKLPVQRMDDHWDDVFGAKDNCTAYFEEHLLAGEEPLVLALDHVDRVFESLELAGELLAMLRAWHEMGKSQAPWDRLRLVLGYSTEMYLPLEINHSPFNVGLPVVLSEWDAATVQELARRHRLSWSGAEVDQVMQMLGGHPHLVRLAMYHVASGRDLAGVLATAATDEGLFADHLKSLLWHLRSRPELREAAERVMGANRPVRLGTEIQFKLVSLGLVHLQGNEVLSARDLYRRYFPDRLSAS